MHTSMNRRKFLKGLSAGVVCAATAGLVTCAKPTDRPNVILIIGDDISVNDFGCYGHPTVKTPNVDRMAQNGIRFTNAFLTASSCSPSRCSIISGRYPHNTGAAELHTPLPKDQLPFPQRLREAGYYCAQAGKWHMGPHARRAFDVIKDQWDGQTDPGAEGEWVGLLQDRPQDKPFFLWLASIDAHRGWDDEIFLERHDPATVQVPPYLADAPATRADLAKYYDEIARLDHFVGKVESELETQGVADNTMIIFMADNGRPFPRCKTRVYDSGMQTPFIVKWPNGIRKQGHVCNSLLSAIDIAPTILDVCGVNIDDSFQGKSFVSLLKNPDEDFRNVVFSEHNWHDFEACERMARTDRYLYVYNARPQLPNCGPADSNNSDSQADLDGLRAAGELSPQQADIYLTPRPQEELFDLKSDPEQFNNVANEPAYAEALQKMRELMQQWRKQTGDTYPTHLTPDWYERFTGSPLDIERKRGEMPGTAANATQINAKGAF